MQILVALCSQLFGGPRCSYKIMTKQKCVKCCHHARWVQHNTYSILLQCFTWLYVGLSPVLREVKELFQPSSADGSVQGSTLTHRAGGTVPWQGNERRLLPGGCKINSHIWNKCLMLLLKCLLLFFLNYPLLSFLIQKLILVQYCNSVTNANIE